MLKIVFMGTPEFAVPSLEALRKAGHEIALVVTNPDRRRDRGAQPAPTPVKQAAMEMNLPVYEAESVTDASFIEKIRSINADLLVVVAFRLLPGDVIRAARLGSVNVHASLLPRYRGAAPIHHAILHGEQETGCTVFRLDERMDTGDILLQRAISIGADDTTGDLYDRLKALGAEVLLDALHGLETGGIHPSPQSEDKASRAPKVGSQDGRIRVEQPAGTVHNRIRAMTPAPGAWTTYRGGRLHLRGSRLCDPTLTPPGTQPGHLTVLKGKPDRLLLTCGGDTCLELTAVQLPGRGVITGAEFARSNPVGSGLIESD